MMEAHPLAAIFPEMSREDFNRLREDIRAHGLRRPITLYEDKILDGRHRHRACVECGVTPRFDQFDGGDPGQFVIAENLTRRHLTPSQIAMVSLNYEAIERERAKARQETGKTLSPIGEEVGGTAEVLGRKFSIGQNTVQRAIAVKKHGVPEIAEKVIAGEMTVNEAEKIVRLGKESQRKIAALPKEERKKAVGKAIAISRGRRSVEERKTALTVEPAGTEFTRALLGRIELIANDLTSRGLRDRDLVIERFVTEFGWGDKVQLQQLWHCMDTMRLIGELYDAASKRARVAA